MKQGLLFLHLVPMICMASPAAGVDRGGDAGLESLFGHDTIGAAPASFVMDDARLFDEDERQRLSASLLQFEAEHGLSLYVAAYSTLIDEVIDQRASRLRDTWLAGKRGIAIVYQSGTERLSFSGTEELENDVSRMDLAKLFADAFGDASRQARASEQVIAAVDRLVADLPTAVQEQLDADAATAAETRRFLAGALSFLLLFAAGGMLVLQFLRRAHADVAKSYTFPNVRVAERFGAPYCGGHQAELRFTVRSE